MAIREDIVRVIREESSDHPSWGQTKIMDKVVAYCEKEGLKFPDASTISRQLRTFKKKSEEERDEYSLFHWPQSMDTGRVPWAASKDALELVMALNEMGYRRPTIKLVNRYWQVRQVMPSNLPLEQVLMVAHRLLEADELDDPSVGYRSIEGLLAYEVYKPQGMALYLESLLGETQHLSDDDEVEIRTGGYWKLDRKYSAKGNLRYEKAFLWARSPTDGNPALLVKKIIEGEDPPLNDSPKDPLMFYFWRSISLMQLRDPRRRGVVKE